MTEQIAAWLNDDHLQLTRIQELLAQQGMPVAYTTLRMAESAPGEIAEMDFGRLGVLIDPATQRHQLVWALVVVLWKSDGDRHGAG